jgi:phage tail-like protein
MQQARGTREGNFGVEIDGIPSFKATKVSGGTDTHTPVELQSGTENRPRLLPGNHKTEDFSFTIASGLHQGAINALAQRFQDYSDRVNMEPMNGRWVVFDDTGRIPVETYELIAMVPVSIKPDDRASDGTGAATTTIMLRPEAVRRIA